MLALCALFLSTPAWAVSVPTVDRELECLTRNMYFEARGATEADKLAVAFVTLTRVVDPRWPDTICEVVYQRRQFSWANVNPNRPVTNPLVYANLRLLAQQVLTQRITQDPAKGAQWYYNYHLVNPSWRAGKEATLRTPYHVYLKAGNSPAFTAWLTDEELASADSSYIAPWIVPSPSL